MISQSGARADPDQRMYYARPYCTHIGNVQSSKDAQEQATLHLKNARKSLGAILVLAHQPTDDTNQCAPENQRSQGQDQGVAQARPFSVLAIVGGQGSPGFGLGAPPRRGVPPAEKLQNPSQ